MTIEQLAALRTAQTVAFRRWLAAATGNGVGSDAAWRAYQAACDAYSAGMQALHRPRTRVEMETQYALEMDAQVAS